MIRTGTSAIALTIGLATASSAWAQTAPSTDNIQQGVPEQRGDPQAAAAETGDIIVTAQRTSSLASKTPIALSAIDGEGLRDAGITNPTRLGEQVPSLSIVRNNGLQITIRGVSSADNTEKGSPSAAFLLDGVYLARPQAQEVSFYDIARVEVLRGPQGTLYGRNTTAGVINVITNRPTHKFQAAANVGYGNYNQLQADAMVNLPVNDAIALRFAGSYERRDSYLVQNVGTPHDLNPFKNNLSGRAQALFTLTPDLTVLIRGDYSSIRGNGFTSVLGTPYYASLPAGAPGYTDPRYVGYASTSNELRQLNYPLLNDPKGDSSSWGIDGEVNWAFGPLALTYLGSYREFRLNQSSTGFQGISYPTVFSGYFKQVSQELRFATQGTGSLKLQFGGYYFREDSNDTLALFNLLPTFPYYAFIQGPTKQESLGAFAQGTYSLTDRLRVTGGVRYSRDQKSRIGGTVMQKAPGPFNPLTDIASPNNASVTSSKVTWRTGLDYDLDAHSLLYGSVATGYKAGGFNGGCLASAPGCTTPRTEAYLFYRPETLTAYEIGLKTRFAGNMVRVNASAFFYDYNNLQVSSVIFDNGAPRQFTANAAKARVKGVELEATLAPSPRNRVDAQFAYLDAAYAQYSPLGIGNPPDYKGRPLDRSPKVVVSAGYTYTLPLGSGGSLAASARTQLSSEYFLTAQSVARQYRQPSYTHTDLTLSYSAPGNRYYLRGFLRNLENSVQVTTISLAGTTLLIAPSDPTTYGVQAGFRF